MTVLTLILILVALNLLLWGFRYHVISLLYYLLVRFERRKIDFQLLGSLRDDLVHERKKKTAGLEMILSSWERGDEVQPRYEYFEELLGQLKNLVCEQRRNLMAVTRDIFLWGKLWSMLRRIEKTSSEKREKSDVPKLRGDLTLFQNVIDEVIEDATKKFSFTLNEVVKESVKIVRIEKSKLKNIEIAEQLDEVGETVRFSYDKFKEWQRVLTNLIRNAVESVAVKQFGVGTVVADLGLPGGEEIGWVKISTKPTETDIGQAGMPDLRRTSVSVIIEDSGIGMDESTKESFYKKGFTSGKEGGLGLGVSEESVEFINRYGNWQIESQKGVGTKITINIDREKAQKAELILPAPKPFFRTRLAFVFSFGLAVLIGLVLLFVFNKYSRFWVDWNPAYAKVEQGRQVFVFNAAGKELWRHEFDQSVFNKEDKLGNKSPLIRIEDLDQDGWNETLVAIMNGAQITGQLFCFDHEGNKKWVFSAGQSFEERSSGRQEDSTQELFQIYDISADDFLGNGQKQILVSSNFVARYPCQLALIDHQGNVIGEYWHPGLVRYVFFMDMYGDRQKELLCAGINNKLSCRPVVFILGIKQLLGKHQAPPCSTFDNLDPTEEEKYVVIPHVKDVTWKWVEVSPLATPLYMDIRADDIFLILWDGRHYSLSKNLECNSCEHRIASFSNWKELIKFPFELNIEIDSLNWKNFEVWENGAKLK